MDAIPQNLILDGSRPRLQVMELIMRKNPNTREVRRLVRLIVRSVFIDLRRAPPPSIIGRHAEQRRYLWISGAVKRYEWEKEKGLIP